MCSWAALTGHGVIKNKDKKERGHEAGWELGGRGGFGGGGWIKQYTLKLSKNKKIIKTKQTILAGMNGALI